jgi:hypothetical protein
VAAASPIQTAFNAGELSPLIAGRVDFQKYTNGCKTLQNFIPTIQGPVVNRPGLHYVAASANATTGTLLIPFVFSETVAFVLEFGNNYIAFYTQHGVLESGGSPYTIASPYTTADLFNADGTPALSFAQSGDVIYIANANVFPQKLIRQSNTSWTIGNVPFTNGPFAPIPSNGTVTVGASAMGDASVTLTASAATFASTDVGNLFYLEDNPSSSSVYNQWQAGVTIATTGQSWQAGLNNYSNTTTGTTGSIEPTTTQFLGFQNDGAPGVTWRYDNSGYCVFQITAFTSATSVTAVPIAGNWVSQGMLQSGGGSILWAKAAWSSVNGFPTVVTFFRDRLVWAQGTQMFFSVAADFENMATEDAGIVSDDMAIIINIASDRYDQIVWMASVDVLLVGTVGSEYAVAEANTSQAFGPTNVESKQQTGNGGRSIPPIIFNSSTLFVQRAGKKLREMRYSFATNNYQSIDLTVLSQHITQGQIVDMDFQQEPNNIVWCVLATGQLVGLVYCREQDTVGWHEHIIGPGLNVEAVACIPTPDGTADELWCIVSLTVNGSPVRYICYMDQGYLQGQNPNLAVYLDLCSQISGVNTTSTTMTITDPSGNWNYPDVVTVTASAAYFAAGNVGSQILIEDASGNEVLIKITGYTSSTVVTGVVQGPVPVDLQVVAVTTWSFLYATISGLGYLQGQTVQALGDGAPQPPQVVPNTGIISLQYPASVVTVGLPYTSTVTTMRFSGGGQTGPGQGMLKRISHCVFRFFNTMGGQYGNDGGPYDTINWRTSYDNMNQSIPLYTGDMKVEWNSSTDFDGYVSLQQAQPLPMTVVAVMPQFFVNDPQM